MDVSLDHQLIHCVAWPTRHASLRFSRPGSSGFVILIRASPQSESRKNRPHEIFRNASGHFVALPLLIQPLGSLNQPLPYPLIGIANQLPDLGERSDVRDSRQKHIQGPPEAAWIPGRCCLQDSEAGGLRGGSASRIQTCVGTELLFARFRRPAPRSQTSAAECFRSKAELLLARSRRRCFWSRTCCCWRLRSTAAGCCSRYRHQ